MLSVVVLTRNEEKNIEECLESVGFADEIVVIDDDSTDHTRAIAKKSGAIIYKRKLAGDFAAQRNFALSKCHYEWILFLDADERVSAKLQREIKEVINLPLTPFEGFSLRRQDRIWGKTLRYGEVGNIKLLRLVRKDSGKWSRKVHEEFITHGRFGLLKEPIVHLTHPSVKEFLAHVNFFSGIHAHENNLEGKRPSVFKIIFWPIGHFVRNYIFKLGFLDGTQGLVVSIMMSFHSYLSWSKQWLSENQK